MIIWAPMALLFCEGVNDDPLEIGKLLIVFSEKPTSSSTKVNLL